MCNRYWLVATAVMACAIAPKAAGRELLVAGVTQIANRKSQIVNPKNQTNHKSQIPHKFKTPNSKGINQGHVWGGELAVWDLRFWICLGFGILDWGFWSRESKNPGKHAIFQGFQGCDSGLSKVEAPGIEPGTQSAQRPSGNALASTPQNALAHPLAHESQKGPDSSPCQGRKSDPDLQRLIDLWSGLGPDVKASILRLAGMDPTCNGVTP